MSNPRNKYREFLAYALREDMRAAGDDPDPAAVVAAMRSMREVLANPTEVPTDQWLVALGPMNEVRATIVVASERAAIRAAAALLNDPMSFDEGDDMGGKNLVLSIMEPNRQHTWLFILITANSSEVCALFSHINISFTPAPGDQGALERLRRNWPELPFWIKTPRATIPHVTRNEMTARCEAMEEAKP